MNIVIDGYVINWANVNYLDRKKHRLHFTSGDFLKLFESETAEIEEAFTTAEAQDEAQD